ncbi:sigma-70 family RNA polymerase sigma factor [Clostridium sp. DL1XJH146]
MYKLESNSFNGYAIRAIRNNILDLFKKNVKLHKEINDDLILNICIDKKLTVEEHILAGEEMKRLYKALDKLTKEEMKIINEYYFNNKTLKTIACENNINYKKMVRNKKMVLERIKENY